MGKASYLATQTSTPKVTWYIEMPSQQSMLTMIISSSQFRYNDVIRAALSFPCAIWCTAPLHSLMIWSAEEPDVRENDRAIWHVIFWAVVQPPDERFSLWYDVRCQEFFDRHMTLHGWSDGQMFSGQEASA